MVIKLTSEKLEEIVKIVFRNTAENQSKYYFAEEITIKDSKEEISNYLQLPDLFNYEKS